MRVIRSAIVLWYLVILSGAEEPAGGFAPEVKLVVAGILLVLLSLAIDD